MSPQLRNHAAALAEVRAAFRKYGQPTWQDVHAGLMRASRAAGEWAGYPMPVAGTRMVVHPSYPFAAMLNQAFMPERAADAGLHEDESPAPEDIELRNEFRSYRDGKTVHIWREGKKFFHTFSRRQNSAPLLLSTLGAARAWDFEAEIRAMETLRSRVSEWAFQCYAMTGSFLETSKRSGVIYLFRRLRPTIAMTTRADRRDRDVGLRILCTLCLHPIGYYEGSWAGALVPTDDVLAHLMLMRGDEHGYWRQANQHQAWAPESGL